MTDYAEISVGPDENGATIIRADGKLLGPAGDVVEFIVRAVLDAEQMKAPVPEWAKIARVAFQSTR